MFERFTLVIRGSCIIDRALIPGYYGHFTAHVGAIAEIGNVFGMDSDKIKSKRALLAPKHTSGLNLHG